MRRTIEPRAMRDHARTLLAVATAVATLSLPRAARADGEAWQQFEYRAPIIQTPRAEFPRFAWRIYTEAREAGRYNGLYDSYLRTGPMLWVSPWLFIAAHATLEGTRAVAGCVTGAIPSCGQYVFEFRAELEPNFFGRIGPFTFNDRNRIEYRWREAGARWRYRNQLRINFQPQSWRVYPFVVDEWLFDLSAESLDHVFNQNRFTAGVAVQLNRNTRLDVGYMLRSRAGPTAADPSWHFEHDHIGLITLVVDVPPFDPATRPTTPVAASQAAQNTTTPPSASRASSAPPTLPPPPPPPPASPAPSEVAPALQSSGSPAP